MKAAVVFFLLIALQAVNAQDLKGSPRPVSQYVRVLPMRFGLEQDVLPYALKGYIFTGWIGRGFTRQRISYAQASAPAFFRGEGIAADRTIAFGFSQEYFFRQEFQGLWFGPGVGYWKNEVETDLGDRIVNESLIFTLGGGYNYYLTNWLYTSPWVALHSRLSGNTPTAVNGIEYVPLKFTPELSIKLGVVLGRAAEN